MTEMPWRPLLRADGFVVVDGGLATELERRGQDLDTPLWSAALLAEAPSEIAAVHRAYLEAGAGIIISASYQASIDGFVCAGFSRPAARTLLRRAVEIAVAARDEFVASGPPVAARPLVAASVGPYGAILADGSEYRGDYALDERGLARFHRDRLALLAAAGADLLAVETIPSLAEARVLARLLADLALPAWVAFSCADGGHLRDGSRIEDAALLFVGVDNVGAIGVNCTAPEHVGALVKRLARAAPAKDIIVYPNRGESWSAARGTWSGTATPPFAEAATWLRAGARLIGGCCRTTPEDIATLRGTLSVAGAHRLHE